MPIWKLINLPTQHHKPGLLVLSEPKIVSAGSFLESKRIYWITNNTGETIVRGCHYHPAGGKEEYLVCLHGKAIVELHSQNGCGQETLADSTTALYLPTGVWHGVTLTPGSILLSVASLEPRPNEANTAKPCAIHE